MYLLKFQICIRFSLLSDAIMNCSQKPRKRNHNISSPRNLVIEFFFYKSLRTTFRGRDEGSLTLCACFNVLIYFVNGKMYVGKIERKQ